MNNPVWSVESVTALPDYTLLLTFTGNCKRKYDAHPLLNKPIYEPLKKLPFFMCAKAECGTVVWNDDIDIAPEYLYEHSTPLNS